MKKVLSTLGIAILSQFSYGQGANCAASTVISANGTLTVPSITGTLYTSCLTGTPSPAPTNGVWYSFTPTSNGSVTISSNLTQNNGTTKRNETRFSVYSGTCSALTCVASSDDVSTSNYLSSATFSVTAGTTYYLQWDNAWVAANDPQALLGFDFSYTFTSCLPVSGLSLSSVSTTNAAITWTAPTPAPSSYNIEYGALGFTQGTGTTATVTTPTFTFPTQTAGANLSFYIRSNCGTTQGSWLGPYNVFLVKNTPYSNNFDTANNRSDGFSAGTGWALAVDDTTSTPPVVLSQSPTGFYYSNTSSTGPANAQLYSRPINLIANQTNNLSFYTRAYAFTAGQNPAPMTLKIYRNTAANMTGAVQIGTAITVNGTTHIQQTSSFTVPTTGTYYLIFSNESAQSTNTTALIFDTFNITSGSLGTNDIEFFENKVSISPNPTSDILNIKTYSKINAVSVVDMTGRKVDVKLNDTQVDVRSLPAGTYLINIETKDGISTEKFIKK